MACFEGLYRQVGGALSGRLCLLPVMVRAVSVALWNLTISFFLYNHRGRAAPGRW